MSDGAAAAVPAAVPTGEKATEKVAAEFVELTRTLNLDSDSLESGKPNKAVKSSAGGLLSR